MSRPRSARLAAGAVLTATSLLAASSAAFAAAPSAAERPGSGEAAGAALSLTVHLPGGAATTIDLLVDPVTGAVSRRVDGKDARAVAALVGSSDGPLQIVFGNAGPLTGRVEARLPSPTSATSDPAAQIGQGLSSTPLAGLLDIRVLGSGARVNAAPASGSTAQVGGLAVGLPAAAAAALQPLTDPLTSGLNTLLQQVSDLLKVPLATICDAAPSPLSTQDRQRAVDRLLSDLRTLAGGKPASDPSVAAALPMMGGLLGGHALAAAAPGAATPPTATPALAAALARELSALRAADLPVLCTFGKTLDQLNSALTTSLKTLTGRGGVLSTGLITASQQITSGPSTVTSTATTSIADLRLLGASPFAAAKALTTTAAASATGRGSSTTATVTSSVAT